jgi:phospholipase D1/2
VIVASYNVHGCVGLDGREDVERIGAVLRELDADVIGLQEVGTTQLSHLASLMGLHPVHGPLLHRLDTDYGNAILCPQPPSAVRFIDLQIGRREPRGAIDADIEVDGQPLRVIATHLGLLGNERRRQMRLLRDTLRATSPRVPLVILADLNEWFAGARTLRSLLDFGGRSVRSFPSSWPALALDRVLVQPAHLVGEVRAHVSPIACVASDHLPVRAELSEGRR